MMIIDNDEALEKLSHLIDSYSECESALRALTEKADNIVWRLSDDDNSFLLEALGHAHRTLEAYGLKR